MLAWLALGLRIVEGVPVLNRMFRERFTSCIKSWPFYGLLLACLSFGLISVVRHQRNVYEKGFAAGVMAVSCKHFDNGFITHSVFLSDLTKAKAIVNNDADWSRLIPGPETPSMPGFEDCGVRP